jgi:hypothetical protein
MKIIPLVILLVSTSICFAQTKDELTDKLVILLDAKATFQTDVDIFKAQFKVIGKITEQEQTELMDILLKHYSWDWYQSEYKNILSELPQDELLTLISLFENNSEAIELLRTISPTKRLREHLDFEKIQKSGIMKQIESDIISLGAAKSEADKWLDSSYEKKMAYLNGVRNATELTFHNYMKYAEFEYSQITNHPAINQLCKDSTQYPDVSVLIEGLDVFYTNEDEDSIFYTNEDRREEMKNIPAITATMIVRDALYGWDIEQRLNEAIALSQKQNSLTNSIEK